MAGSEKRIRPLSVLLAVAVTVSVGVAVYVLVRSQKQADFYNTYLQNVAAFCEATENSLHDINEAQGQIDTVWQAFVDEGAYEGRLIVDATEAVEIGQKRAADTLARVQDTDRQITEQYRALLTVYDLRDEEFIRLKDAVKRVRDAYRRLYDGVVSPEGHHAVWADDFGDARAEYDEALQELREYLK